MNCGCQRHDWIELTGVRGFGRHGLLDFELENGQDFVVDVRIGLPLAAAGRNDDLTATIDYAELAVGVHGLITGEPVGLIEALAERIAGYCLSAPLAHEVEVVVHKPAAPIPVAFDDVAVRILRTRGDA